MAFNNQASLFIVSLSAFLLSACAIGNSGGVAPPVSESTSVSSPLLSEDRVPCEDGRLLIADLTEIDALLEEGLASVAAVAAQWQPDARLVEFRVVCALFEPGFRWQGIFFSDTSQVLFASDTQETTPTDRDPALVSTLSLDQVSYGLLHRSLLKAGFTDDLEIGATSGVDLRMNTADFPFGPGSAPEDVSMFYVSILRGGEVKDVFVDTVEGSVYRETLGR